MRQVSVVGEPEIEDEAVVLRVVVEDPALADEGGVFVCRMRDYGTIAVEAFPRGLTPSSDGEFRVEAAHVAMRHALENREQFDALFAKLQAH
jgi:hypothetical protein